jgi:hypothetical protein
MLAPDKRLNPATAQIESPEGIPGEQCRPVARGVTCGCLQTGSYALSCLE